MPWTITNRPVKPAGLARPLVYSLLWLGLAACESIAYYGQAISGHLDLMHNTRVMEAVLEDPSTSQVQAQRLREVLSMRDFASAELALPDNGSYRSYAELRRKAVVWSLVATPEFWLEPLQWCYPVLGCASYRGYFDHAVALKAAEKLKRQGRDVAVEPVAAYSTLGWFDDPLPSTVLDWPKPLLAGLIFHELAHQRLYVPGDSAFNEAFATVVESAGVRRWLVALDDEKGLSGWEAGQVRKRQFTGLLLETRQRLMDIYTWPVEPELLREHKQAEFRRLRSEYAALKARWGDEAEFDSWFQRPVNNARLASVGTYHLWVGAFENLLCGHGGDMPAFYREARTLGELPRKQREQALLSLSTQDRRRNCM